MKKLLMMCFLGSYLFGCMQAVGQDQKLSEESTQQTCISSFSKGKIVLSGIGILTIVALVWSLVKTRADLNEIKAHVSRIKEITISGPIRVITEPILKKNCPCACGESDCGFSGC